MNLFNSNSRFLDRFFRRVDGLVWDLSTGKLGVQQSDGIYTCEITQPEAARGQERGPVQAQISINPFDQFGISIPAFATNTQLEQISVGDLIVGAREILGWVIEKKPASLVLLDTKGMTKQYSPPKVAVINQNGCMVVKSLTGLLGDGAAGFQSSLLPLLVMGEGTGLDMDKLIPLMLFSQTNGAGNGMGNMMQTVMMMQALGGNVGRSSGGQVERVVAQGSNVGHSLQTGGVPPLTATRRTR